MAGTLIGIALRAQRRAPMVMVGHAVAVAGGGLQYQNGAGVPPIDHPILMDHKGIKFPRRGITILAREDWQAALDMLVDLAGPVPLPWTVRRANLLVEGVRLPRAKGAVITIGGLIVRVTGQTVPCQRMDEAHMGLRKALHPHWRGGVTTEVIEGAVISNGDAVTVISSPPEHTITLPG